MFLKLITMGSFIFFNLLLFMIAISFYETDALYDYHTNVTGHMNWHLLDNHGHCGKGKLPFDKTLGGKNADLAEYPWMARLIFRKKDDSEMGGCGGSVINNRNVLTAAHCCPDEDSDPLAIVRLGEYDIHRTTDCFQGKCAPPPLEFNVEEIIIHHMYDRDTLRNDICLLRLSEEVEFNDYVQPICLPTSEEFMTRSFVGTTLTLTGWGDVESVPEGRLPNTLQEVRLRVVPGTRCRSWDEESFDASTMICAGNFVGRDACAGDSGGPLMYADTDARQYILGIVSSGISCSSQNGKPIAGEYTRVSKFITWILDAIRD